MNRVDLLKSGSVTHGHEYDIYLNWKPVMTLDKKKDSIEEARLLARRHNAELHVTV